VFNPLYKLSFAMLPLVGTALSLLGKRGPMTDGLTFLLYGKIHLPRVYL